MRSFTKKLDQFFDRIPGGYFGLAGVVIIMVLFIISMSLFNLADPFSFFKHWVSHLGIGANGADVLFSVALIAGGTLFIPFVVFLFRYLWSEEGRGRISDGVGMVAALLSITGAFLSAIFDMEAAGSMHVISANLFFISATVFIGFFTAAMIFTKKYARWHLLVTGIVLVLFAIFYPVVFYSSSQYFPDKDVLTMGDWVEFMTAMGPELNLVRFFEWLALFGVFAWIAATAILMLRERTLESRAEVRPE